MPPKYSINQPEGFKACSQCHENKPLSDFGRNAAAKDALMACCKPCSSKRSRDWQKANPEKARASDRRWRERNPDAPKALWQRWYKANQEHLAKYKEANKEKRRAYCRASAERNKASRLAADRARYLADPAKARARTRAYQISHPERVREQLQRRKALLRAATVEPVDYLAIIRRDRSICGICGLRVKPFELQFDHIVPLSKGGAHAERNIQVAHARCNLRKQDKLIDHQMRLAM